MLLIPISKVIKILNLVFIPLSFLSIIFIFKFSINLYKSGFLLKTLFSPTLLCTCNESQRNNSRFWVDKASRNKFIELMRYRNIVTPFDYVPLHNSPFGSKISRVSLDLLQTKRISSTLVRLPLWLHMPEICFERIINQINALY